jgi:hypothetical protein
MERAEYLKGSAATIETYVPLALEGSARLGCPAWAITPDEIHDGDPNAWSSRNGRTTYSGAVITPGGRSWIGLGQRAKRPGEPHR